MMRLHEIRKNPEKNPKLSVVEFLQPYANDDTYYLHTGPIAKVGVNPSYPPSHDSPAGIYAFNLKKLWPSILRHGNLSGIGYHGGDKVFVLKSDVEQNSYSIYSKSDMFSALDKLEELSGESYTDDASELIDDGYPSLQVIYLLTRRITNGGFKPQKWANLLRKIGITRINDPGYGYIHGAEDHQTLFLQPSEFEVIDMMDTKVQPSGLNLGPSDADNRRYGHVKTLTMQSPPNTFFHNNSPENMKGVKRWEIQYVNLRDVDGIVRMGKTVPDIVIGTIGIDGSDRGVSASVAREIETVGKKLTPNVKIGSFTLITHDAMKAYMVLSKLTDFSYPIKLLVQLPEYYASRLPENIKRLLVQ